MRTNIVLNEQLVKEAMRLSQSQTRNRSCGPCAAKFRSPTQTQEYDKPFWKGKMGG